MPPVRGQPKPTWSPARDQLDSRCLFGFVCFGLFGRARYTRTRDTATTRLLPKQKQATSPNNESIVATKGLCLPRRVLRSQS